MKRKKDKYVQNMYILLFLNPQTHIFMGFFDNFNLFHSAYADE